MKNLFSSFFNLKKDKKEKVKEEEKEYCLCCDFGYDITSPIPSVEPLHKNAHCCVPAAVGTAVKLFPGDPERFEYAEFVSFITDENRQVRGMKCRIRPDNKIIRLLGDREDLVWEVDLICGKEVFAEDNSYENGKNTHTYRKLLLQTRDGAAQATQSE
ncbi:MAG: hypothetical protein J5569_07115 [Oscillospiraceae bacterium]|nr:hypothetical protein [Oscillospiraceae bacterium]